MELLPTPPLLPDITGATSPENRVFVLLVFIQLRSNSRTGKVAFMQPSLIGVGTLYGRPGSGLHDHKNCAGATKGLMRQERLIESLLNIIAVSMSGRGA